jgi:hypothetical protein
MGPGLVKGISTESVCLLDFAFDGEDLESKVLLQPASASIDQASHNYVDLKAVLNRLKQFPLQSNRRCRAV